MGVETLLKYKPDERFFGWLAYTLSRSVLQDAPDSPTYLFQYDQTHNLTVLGSYRLGRGWEFGARFRLVSGPLDTPVQSRPPCRRSMPPTRAPTRRSRVSPTASGCRSFTSSISESTSAGRSRTRASRPTSTSRTSTTTRRPRALVYNYDFSKSQYQTGVPILPSLGMRVEI